MKKITTKEKISIVLAGLNEPDNISAICARSGIDRSLYNKWEDDFLEAGRRKLDDEIQLENGAGEMSAVLDENDKLKQLVIDLALKNRELKRNLKKKG